MPASNAAARLDAYVARCIALAPSQSDPPGFLMRNAGRVELKLQALALDVPSPAGLEGLDAWSLSEAVEALEAAAARLR